MVMHTIHNSLILLMQAYAKELTAMGIGTEQGQHVPTMWLVGAAVSVIVAVGIMRTSRDSPVQVGQVAA